MDGFVGALLQKICYYFFVATSHTSFMPYLRGKRNRGKSVIKTAFRIMNNAYVLPVVNVLDDYDESETLISVVEIININITGCMQMTYNILLSVNRANNSKRCATLYLFFELSCSVKSNKFKCFEPC